MEVVKEKVELKRYSNYKETGFEWIGEIPSHWEVKRLKYLISEINERSKTGKEELLSLSKYKGITPKSSLEERSGGAESLIGYKIVKPNQLVINKMQAVNGLLAVSKISGITSPDYSVYCSKNRNELNIDFLGYLLNQPEYLAEFKRRVTGVMEGFIRLYTDDLFGISIHLPTYKEQTAISHFLDCQTEQIDEAIEIKQKQIELLKERRQILIHKAVTRGLNPDAPFKPSGVDWIGDIPEHWEVKKIKYVTSKIGSGLTPSGGATTYIEDGIPLLRSQNIHFGRIDYSDVAYITESTHKSMSNSQVKKGDVLLNITGGSLGRCHYVVDEREMNVNQHVCILRPTEEIQTVYLNGLIASKVGQGQIWFYQQGGGREGLNFQAIKNFFIPLPPTPEQIEISNKVDRISSGIFEAVSEIENQIQKLKEYKTTLINSAVTGKIKVS